MNYERTTAYLLDELTQREAEEFEEQCFAQTEWPEVDLESAEEDLIQAYIKEELSPERRRRFEENYLTTEARKERLLLARSFLRVACSATTLAPAPVTLRQRIGAFFNPQTFSPRTVVPRLASVVLAVGLVVTSLLVIRQQRTPQTFANVSLVIATETRSDTRSTAGPPKKVTLPIAEDALRISLTLPGQAPEGTTYRVQWEDLRGPLEDLEVEKQDANSISVIIPTEKLKPGQYTLKLHRKNPDGTEQRVPGNYYFDVE